MACWGRALSSFAFRTVTPSTAICIKMEEWGEQRGEGVGDGFREEREQDGWTDAERNKASSCPTNHMTNMVRKSISGYEIKIPVRRCMTRGYYITLNSKSSLWICADNSFWPTYIRCAWECNSSLPNTAPAANLYTCLTITLENKPTPVDKKLSLAETSLRVYRNRWSVRPMCFHQ